MATERKIEANRMNALKSTGPKTPEGKAVVSKNAVSHGILSDTDVMEEEDPKRFYDFADAMRSCLQPVGEIEALMVDRIISNTWRMRRLLEAEAWVQWELGVLPHEGGRDNFSGYAYMRGDFPPICATFNRYESMLERGLFRALHELQRLQASRAGQDVPPPAAIDIHVHGG